MPECEAYPDMRAHEDARLTDEVPESVCFIIMDSKMSSGGKLPEKFRRHTRIHRKPMEGHLPEHRKCTVLSITALDKKENMWVRTQ